MTSNSIEKNRWVSRESIEIYNRSRDLVREASSEVVKKVFNEYVSPEYRIVEIGSGLGELSNILSGWKGQIRQTELSIPLAYANKNDSGSDIIVSDVYNLPFSGDSFDVVVGYSVFDVLFDLSGALKEVRKVLVPNGKFIHFLDMEACTNVMDLSYSEDAEKPDGNKFFFKNLENSLKKNGYRILEFEKMHGISLVEKNKRHSDNSPANFFKNETGSFSTFYSPEIEKMFGNTKALIYSELHVAVAENS